VRLSVILTTYQQAEWLRKTLWGYAVQTNREFELLIADDGSGPETRAVVEEARREMGLDPVHVWHEDRGFRKCEILNRAILESTGDYLIFSDGDCIPRADFVETHARLARPGRYLSGGYLKLSASVSEAIGWEDVRTGRAMSARWLRARGWRPGRRVVRLLPRGPVAAALDVLTPTRPTWNGHNASTWREAIFEVNGFEAAMGWGGLDRALGERLENLGCRGRQIRHRAPVLHLHHERPYRRQETVRRNREIREAIRRERQTRAACGLAEAGLVRREPAEPEESE
jgi:glycosyltransferase involved in cell wall biosynthesis